MSGRRAVVVTPLCTFLLVLACSAGSAEGRFGWGQKTATQRHLGVLHLRGGAEVGKGDPRWIVQVRPNPSVRHLKTLNLLHPTHPNSKLLPFLASLQDRKDGRNVNSWHWEEKDMTQWAKQRLGSIVGIKGQVRRTLLFLCSRVQDLWFSDMAFVGVQGLGFGIFPSSPIQTIWGVTLLVDERQI